MTFQDQNGNPISLDVEIQLPAKYANQELNILTSQDGDSRQSFSTGKAE